MKQGYQRLCQAIDNIRKTRPVYATALFNMERVEDSKIETMATDGVKLYYCDKFCIDTCLADLQFIVMHEVLHKWMLHCKRIKELSQHGETQQKRANVAADLAVNSILLEQGECLKNRNGCIPGEGKYYDFPHSKTMEWYYNKLEADNTDVSDAESDLIPSSESSEIDQLQEVSVSIASAGQQTIGKRSTNVIKGLLDQLVAPPTVDWRTVLKQYLTANVSKRKRSFSRESRRDSEFILPSHVKDKGLCRTAIILDTSGSMTELKYKVLAEAFGIIRCYSGASLQVIMADTDVQYTKEVKTESDIAEIEKMGFVGGGGTCMRSAFARAITDGAKLIVCVTDMCMCFPPRPVIPVVWCDTYGSSLKPDYGDVIKIKEKV
jgi:predicted metal-dependent peptidase